RELVQQIYTETRKYSKMYDFRVIPIYGGASKKDQFKELRKGSDVVIAAPGRLLDMVKMKALKLDKVSFLVLDEADRMFSMGFEQQIRTVIGQIRPDRQTLLFSATFERNLEKLARDVLTDPIRITIGRVGQANEDVTQTVCVLNKHEEKWP